MIFKNIDVHNAAHLIECEGGGVRWLRVPETVYGAMESEGGKRACGNSTGIELRFVMKGDTVKLRIKGRAAINVFFGGLQGAWDCFGEGSFFCGESEIVINKPHNMEMLKKVSADSGYGWSVEVVRVVCRGSFELLDVEGDVCPPERSQLPQRTLLTYGSSITHGSNSVTPSCTWSSVLAHNLNFDLINLGMPGSCRMEPELIDYIASEGEKSVWDVALLELGINVLSWDKELICQRVSNVLHQVAGRNPDKKIYVISPLYCHNDYLGGTDARKWRDCIESQVKETSYPNVEYINGLDVLGNIAGLSADMVHPNIYGIQQIATALTERIVRSASSGNSHLS